MTAWAIGMLNEFRLEADDQVVARLRSRYWERLLAMVAVNVERPVARREIAAVLWPSSPWQYSRNRVSRELGTLRGQLARIGLPPDTILISHTALRLRPDLDTDVRRFERLVDQGVAETDIATRLQLLTTARDLYGRGLLPILEGEWLAPERKRLAAVHSRAISCLLETARHTAGIDLASGVVPAARAVTLTETDDRHIEAMVAFADEASEMLGSAKRNEWLGEVDLRLGGLLLAIEKAIAGGDRQSAMWIAGGIWKFWYARGRIEEGRHYVDAALAVDGDGDTVAEAIALHASGSLELALGNYDLARSRFQQARAVFRSVGDREGEAQATGNLGNVALRQGQHDESREWYTQAIQMAGESPRRGAAIGFLRGIAVADTRLGDLESAEMHMQQIQSVARETGNVDAEAHSLAQMASLAQIREDWARSMELSEQAGEIYRTTHDLHGMALVLRQQGYANVKLGSTGRARESLESALELARAIGHPSSIGDSQYYLGVLEAAQGNYEAAVRWGERAVDTLRDAGHAASADDAESDLKLWTAALGGQLPHPA